jgi:hypothetical protein
MFSVAQLGSVNYMDKHLTKADFSLDSLSGSIQKAVIESKSFDVGKITNKT